LLSSNARVARINDLARYVRFRREEVLKISQEELSRRARLSLSTVQEIEDPKNDRRRNNSTLEALARGLGTTVERLRESASGKLEELGGEPFFSDSPFEIEGLIRVPVVDFDELPNGELAPKYFAIPESAGDGRPMFASVVRDDGMSPRILKGDVVVWVDDGEVYAGRSHWISLADGGKLVRQLKGRGTELELIPLNPAFDRSFVARSEVTRFGRIIYLGRNV
jgi:transcriptional regulator with XRE-family HTH domain